MHVACTNLKIRLENCQYGQFPEGYRLIKWGSEACMAGSSENRRRSERVMLRMTVVVFAEDEERKPIQEETQTQVVNAHGGLMLMRAKLHVGQSFILRNPRNGMEAPCRAVRSEEQGMEFYQIAFEFDQPYPNFWPVVFPPADWKAPAATAPK